MKKIIVVLMMMGQMVCFGQAGNWLWARQGMGVRPSGYEDSESATTDVYGNVYVTGIFHDSTITFGSITLINAGSDDMFVVKYDSNGNVLWAKSGGGIGYDFASSVATDTAGNVYLTGLFSSPQIVFGTTILTNTVGGGAWDMFIVKFSSAGTVLWAKKEGGVYNDIGNSVATDILGNVYVAGQYDSPSIIFGSDTLTNSGSSDMFIVKYDALGNVLWAKSDIGTSGDLGYSVVTDIFGNPYVTGWFNSLTMVLGSDTLNNANNTGSAADMFIVKYNTNGAVNWAKRAGGINADYFWSETTDSYGNLYATGPFSSPTIVFGSYTLTNIGGYDMFIVKYDSIGNVMWAISSGGINNETAYSLASDASGIYVTGSFTSPSIVFGADTLLFPTGATDPMFFVKYDFNGNVICTMILPSGGDDICAITTDGQGNVYLAGDFYNVNPFILGVDTLLLTGLENIFVAKYNCNGIPESTNEITNPQSTITLFPNPATNSLTITFAEEQKNTTIKIMNVLGETVLVPPPFLQGGGKGVVLDLSNIAEGMYFVQIKTEKGMETRKLIIAK